MHSQEKYFEENLVKFATVIALRFMPESWILFGNCCQNYYEADV